MIQRDWQDHAILMRVIESLSYELAIVDEVEMSESRGFGCARCAGRELDIRGIIRTCIVDDMIECFHFFRSAEL